MSANESTRVHELTLSKYTFLGGGITFERSSLHPDLDGSWDLLNSFSKDDFCVLGRLMISACHDTRDFGTYIQLCSMEPNILRVRTSLTSLSNDLSSLHHLFGMNYRSALVKIP